MSHLVRATELWQQWENKQISDFTLIKKQREIIHEMSDEIIRLETENAGLIEDITDIGIENIRLRGKLNEQSEREILQIKS